MPLRPTRPAGLLLLAAVLPFAGCASLNRIATTNRSPLDWNGQRRIELPLTLDSVGRPNVPARINGQEVLVLIDSGGGWPSMTPALATATGERARGTAVVNGATYAAATSVPVQLGSASLQLDRVTIGEQTADTQFTIGPELLLQAVVDMDFDNGRVSIIRPDAWTPPPDEPVDVHLWWTKPTVELHVNDQQQPVCAVLDTGFNAGVALSGEELDALALPRSAGVTTVTGFGGVRWNAATLPSLHEVRFSDQHYRDVPLTEKKSGVQWDCPNLVGMGVLSHHHIVFDLPHRRIWLLPRATATVASR